MRVDTRPFPKGHRFPAHDGCDVYIEPDKTVFLDLAGVPETDALHMTKANAWRIALALLRAASAPDLQKEAPQ